MAYKTLYLCSRSVDLLMTGSRSPSYVLGSERVSILLIVYTAVSVHSWTTLFFVTITVLKAIQARPRNVAADSSLENTPLSMSKSKLSSVSSTPLTVNLSSMLTFFRTYAFFVHWPLVNGIVECSRIYHMLSNLLGIMFLWQ